MSDNELPRWMIYTPDSQLKEPVDLDISGTIPKWVSGTLYRNGGGLYQIGDTTMKHLFDGFAVLHKFVVHDGRASYINKLLDSDALQKCLKANRLVVGQLGTAAVPDPCQSMFARLFSYFTRKPEFNDNTNVNIVPHGDVLLGVAECPAITVIDPETLSKKETKSLANMISVHLSTGHPHVGEDGAMYNLGTAMMPQRAYNLVRIPPPETDDDVNLIDKASVLCELPSRWKRHISYNHSFGMTENYFIILEQTLVVDLIRAIIVMLLKYEAHKLMANYPNEKTLFRVVNRSSSKEVETRYTASGFNCFHFVNCHEDDGHIVADLCVYDGDILLDSAYMKNTETGVAATQATFQRFVLPLNVCQVPEGTNLVTLNNTSATAVKQADGSILCTPDANFGDVSDNLLFELPRINYEYNANKYSYAYGLITGVESKLSKLDVDTKAVKHWKAEPHELPSEPVFVGRPGATAEDDGVVLSQVVSMHPDHQHYLLILDAKSFTELGRATVPSGIKMPFSFHGSFMPKR